MYRVLSSSSFLEKNNKIQTDERNKLEFETVHFTSVFWSLLKQHIGRPDITTKSNYSKIDQ